MELILEIEKLRNELDEMMYMNQPVTKDILQTSQKLDLLIVKYIKTFQRNKINID